MSGKEERGKMEVKRERDRNKEYTSGIREEENARRMRETNEMGKGMM